MRTVLMRYMGLCLVVLVAASAGCRKSEDFMAKGDALLAQKKYLEAAIQYRNAVAQNRESGQAHYKLAQALAQADLVPEGLKEYVRAADLLPTDIAVQLDATRALLLQDRMEDAKTRAEGILKIDPNNVDAHILRGNATAGLKNLDDAILAVKQAIDINPDRGDAYVNLASMQLAQGQFERAEIAYKRAIEVSPKSIAAHLALANFYWLSGKVADAEKLVKDAIAIESENVRANRTLATMYGLMNRMADIEAPLKVIAKVSKDLDDQLVLGDYYVNQKRFADAKRVFESLAGRQEAALAVRARLAGIEYVEGQRDRAHKMVDELLTKNPSNSQLLVLKGGWLLEERKVAAALERAKAAVAADGKSVDAQNLLGTVYLALGNGDEAINAFTAVNTLSPGSIRAKVELADLYLRLRRYAPAEQFAREALALQANNGVARLFLARALLGQGQVPQARAELAPVLDTNPNTPAVQQLAGEIAYRRNDRAEATRAFERVLAKDPGSVEALRWLVQMDLDANQPAAARARVDRRLQQAPNDAELLVLAARTYVTAGDLAPGEALLKRAIQADPSLMEAYHVLGQIYVRQKKIDAAIREYESIVDKHPENVGAHTMVAMMLQAQKKPDEARKRYERILTIDSRAPVAANNLAYMDAEAGLNLDVALNRAQTAKAALPDNADVSDTLGWVQYKKELALQALGPLQFSVDKDPKNPIYHYHLGMAHWKAGNKVQAKSSLQRALGLSSSFEGASEAKRVLGSMQG